MLGYADADGRVAIYRRPSRTGTEFDVLGRSDLPRVDIAPLEARRRGGLVVLSSWAGSGRVLPRAVLRERGFVAADNLNPQKARVLVMLALTSTDDVAEVQRIFDEY